MAESGTAIITSEDLRTVTFDTSRWRSGYDTREVDEFLDRAADELDLPVEHRSLTAEYVGQVQFHMARAGYTPRAVDDFLDLVQGQLAADAGVLPPS